LSTAGFFKKDSEGGVFVITVFAFASIVNAMFSAILFPNGIA
jgi:hypothetical protein